MRKSAPPNPGTITAASVPARRAWVAAPFAVLLVTALVAGCGGDEESSADVSSLEDLPWVLAAGVDVDGWEATPPSVTFADGTAAGSTGCNRFGGSYTVDGDTLELGELAQTAMGCPPPTDAVERAYVAALERVAGWRSENEELVLVDDDDAELLRYRVATPVGSWEATGIPQGDAFASLLSGTEITASFDEGGELTGSAGCNTYRATYTADRGAIEISAPATTKMACAEPAGIMEQEAAFLLALPTAVRYRVEGSTLELLSDEDTLVASFTRAQGE